MSLKTDLENALKDAIRAKDEVIKSTLRLALSAIKLVEVEKQTSLEDDAIISVLQKEVKSRRESIEDAKHAERPELIRAAEAEITVLEKFLPQALSAEELEALVKEVIVEVGASSPADMGNVMKSVIPRLQGRADGGQVSKLVTQLLQND
ncbi:MAG: GatB/YqeY domain-containing protein [Chloroflexi bacterium]|nr:GatB/YqeY domain-containing protein [Chloroflexota bacterium]